MHDLLMLDLIMKIIIELDIIFACILLYKQNIRSF